MKPQKIIMNVFLDNLFHRREKRGSQQMCKGLQRCRCQDQRNTKLSIWIQGLGCTSEEA